MFGEKNVSFKDISVKNQINCSQVSTFKQCECLFVAS